MKWYASRLGLSQATFSKYVQKLVNKGLVEKYHALGNRKDIILMLSPLAQREYEAYSREARERWFQELFDLLDKAGPEELDTVRRVFSILGRWHREKVEESSEEPAALIRVR